MERYSSFQNTMLLLARIITAAIFLYAAYAKLPLWSLEPATSGMPLWLFYLMLFLSIAEPIGALAILVGFLTRLASICLAIIMIGAVFVMQFQMGIGFATPMGTGWNFPLMALGSLLVLIGFGPGNFSVHGTWHAALNRPISS